MIQGFNNNTYNCSRKYKDRMRSNDDLHSIGRYFGLSVTQTVTYYLNMYSRGNCIGHVDALTVKY